AAIFLFLTVAVLVPLGCIYNICIVLPAIHEPGGFPHTFTCLLAIFILLNIEANFLASMMTDTSVDCEYSNKYSLLRSYAIYLVENCLPPPDGTKERLEWTHCQICDKLAPPRSWHCKLCGVCILKRSHHCGFTGYCVGHQNERYFMCFVLYTVVGSVYSTIFNAIYMLRFRIYSKLFLHVLAAHIWIWSELTFWSYLQLFIFGLNLTLLGLSIAALIIKAPSLWRGQVCFAKQKQCEYNNGVINNLKSVFGLRMHVAWLFPTVNSPLPEDGYNWKI
ncbi:hypothetical protein KR044_011065, partial [Drosophila immigrans]